MTDPEALAQAGFTRFSREMGITHAEFFRSLPAALGDRPYALLRNGVTLAEGHRRIDISLGQEQTRTLGRLKIPTTPVTFIFTGFSAQEIEHFMAVFDLHFQRGGG